VCLLLRVLVIWRVFLASLVCCCYGRVSGESARTSSDKFRPHQRSQCPHKKHSLCQTHRYVVGGPHQLHQTCKQELNLSLTQGNHPIFAQCGVLHCTDHWPRTPEVQFQPYKYSRNRPTSELRMSGIKKTKFVGITGSSATQGTGPGFGKKFRKVWWTIKGYTVRKR